MELDYISTFLWILGFLVDLILLAVLFVRKRTSSFPAFTSLVLLNVVRSTALFLIRKFGTPFEYFYTFWGVAVLDTGIQVAVGYEVATKVFRPAGKWAEDIKTRLLLWCALSLIVAAGITFFQQPVAQAGLGTYILKTNLFFSTLLAELFVVMLVLSSISGLNWKSHVAAIAKGLAIYSFSNILIGAAVTVFGFGDAGHVYDDLQLLRRALNIFCAAYWTVQLWRDAPLPREMTHKMRDQISAIRAAVTTRVEALDSEKCP
jgi:hypothetical protein